MVSGARTKRVLPVAGLAIALVGAAEIPATAGEPDAPSPAHPRSLDRSDGTNPLRGSTLALEQSMTTQTASVGDTPQSFVPLYELWLSFRPRWWFDPHWSVRLRFDYTKELTNDQPTTTYRQDVFGDTWTDGVYFAQMDDVWKGTKADAGLRALWPTSLASQAEGMYAHLGPRAGVEHDFTINGDGARWLNVAYVILRANYLHAFSRASTPTDYGTFTYTRQNADGVSFVSDEVSGQTIVRDELQVIAEAGLQVTPSLSVAIFGVLFNDWHDSPAAMPVATATGPVTPTSATPVSGSDQQFSQKTWFVASVDYDVLDELQLGIGYYNLANAVAPDGASRGLFGSDTIWWSPDARFSFTATANLDVLYDDAVRPHARGQSARAASASR